MSEQTVRIRREGAHESPQGERRIEERYPCKRRPLIRILARPSFLVRTAVLVDLSVSGIGLLLEEYLEPGTVLAIQLQGKHTGVSRILSARVRYAHLQADGNWRHGCALSSPLPDEELQGLLEEGP